MPTEDQYRLLFERTPCPMWVFERDTGRFLAVNEAAVQCFGYTADEFLSLSIKDLCSDDGAFDPFGPAQEPPTSAASGSWVSPGVWRLRKKEGTLIDVEIACSPTTFGAGPAILVLARDFSVRKQAERALKDSEERYRHLVEISPDAILIHREGRITFLNPAGARLFGAGFPERMIGFPILDIVHPDHRGMAEARIRSVAEYGVSTPLMEQKWVRLDGSTVEVEVTGTPFIDGKNPAIQVIARDITKRRIAQREAWESHERFLLVARATNDLVWDWDLVTDTLWWNDGVRSVLGYAPEDVDPSISWWYERIHPEDRERIVSGIHSVIEQGGRFWSGEYRYRRADGTDAHFYDRGYVLREESGTPVRMIGAMLDVTERKRAEIESARLFEEVRMGRERLEILSLRLVALQEAERREIARELHDEIGQQLTGLKLILEMKENRPGSAEAAPEAQRIVRDLMERVRELSMNLRPPMLDDLGLVPALLWHLERYTLQTRIGVEFHHAGIQRFTQEVETGAFRIVQEALTNVARHGQAARAKVTLRSGPERLQIVVEDEGAGFDAKSVFERTWGGIAGLRERARLLGGDLVIESSPGSGTRLSAEISLAGTTGGGRPGGE